MASSRGATLLGPDKLELREYPIPDIPADGGLIKIEMGGVCGTDVKYLHGKLKVDYPIILGHEILGRVEKLGKNAFSKAPSVAAVAPIAGATTNVSAASAPTTAAAPSATGRRICSAALPTTSISRPMFCAPK
jgi:threonine dehydrogenase-like Zn-dependent dehydrogenase